MKKLLAVALTMCLLSACQKEISIDLNSTSPQLVIEGTMTNQNEPCQVRITRTVNFSETNKFPGVSGAVVKVSDNTGATETLIEKSAGVYVGSMLMGVEGRTYTLSVQVDGKSYQADSRMPTAVPLRSISFEKSESGPNKGNFTPTPVFDDPIIIGNNYRFIQTINGVIDPTYILTNDNVVNGKTNVRPILSRDFEVKEGDTYSLEMHCIDKVTYDYFFTLAQIEGNGPGGGTTPSNPPNNLTGDALGYFAAYTVQRMTTTAKELP
jgi:Domain of unknown function (DUF4249)